MTGETLMKHSSIAVLIKYIPTIICSLTFTSTTFTAMNTQATELLATMQHNRPTAFQKKLSRNCKEINQILPLPLAGAPMGTPLQYACYLNKNSNCLQAIEILLNHPNICIKKESPNFSPALHIAAQNGQLKLVRLIVTKQPDSYKSRDKNGQTPLHHAAAHNHSRVIDFLLSCGSDINAKDNQGNTPLHLAAERQRHNPIKCLLDKQAKTTLRNKEGLTPFTTFITTIKTPSSGKKTVQAFFDSRKRQILYCAFTNALIESHTCPTDVINLILQLYYQIKIEELSKIAATKNIDQNRLERFCDPQYIDLI